MTNDRKSIPWPVWSAIIVFLLAIALYAVNLGGTYIYDDVPVVVQDWRLHPKAQWERIWTQSYNGKVDQLYRPLITSSYALQWQLHGDRPWAFHLINILLHAACCVCVGEFARRLLGNHVGLTAGLLFTAHPIHVEAVAYIVGRAELACGLGIFAALLLALKPITFRRALTIAICFVVAVLSKEQGMLLPLLIPILLFFRHLQNRSQPLGTRNGLFFLPVLLFGLLGAYLICREKMFGFEWNRNELDWTINPLVRSTGMDRWLVPIEILGRYVALFVAPIRLSLDYGANVIEPFAHFQQPYFAIGIAAVVGWCALLVITWRRKQAALVYLLLGLAMTYGLVGNMITLIGTSMGERLMYTPSAFLFILLAYGLSAAIPKRVVFNGVIAILIGLASLRTLSYAIRWNDAIALYETSARAQPESVHAQLLLANEYRARGFLDQAEQANQRAIALRSDYWDCWFQAGQVAAEKGQLDQAEAYFTKSNQLHPTIYASAWLNSELPRRRAATQQAATSQPR